MTTRPTMEWSSLTMGSRSSTLTMESQSSSSTCSTILKEQKPILAGEYEIISGPDPKGVWRLQGLMPSEPKLPDPLADLTLAFFSLRGQDVALGALKFYNFILRNKDVLFFSKPEARGLRLRTPNLLALQKFFSKIHSSAFANPNDYVPPGVIFFFSAFVCNGKPPIPT
ncbi:hypothetical protein BT96DRAFT_942392 [Gymnopus androsaceus JB14]|uniref:Uncharacterized protein n=1 Tax=Gymnopus androsaceus JB14 TaxID=1447944 RepID=A0A6A4HE30_9AGAR|nr:hypothetical protein BT96DRAFT_942392 [Gymnopus androsaceus JB14]